MGQVRLLHTADWHLGRIFHGVHLTEDQAFVLDELVRLAADTKPELVLVSGDVYDRAVPPPQAVELLDEVLTRLVLDVGTRVVVIAGNHDSPSRLEFAARLTADRGLHVFGSISPHPAKTRVNGVEVVALPWADPATVRSALGGACATHDDALRVRLGALGPPAAGVRHRVLAAHLAVRGGRASESERSFGGTSEENVDASAFEGFSYVALGHLHRPQAVGGESVRYAGSLLKYSFSEESDSKSATLVELDSSGEVRSRPLPLAPRRDVRRMRAQFDEILRRAPGLPWREDYIAVTLEDRAPVFDAMGRLREVLPNLLAIERAAVSEEVPPLEPAPSRAAPLDDGELFARFFRDATGEDLSSEEEEAFAAVTGRLKALERESSP